MCTERILVVINLFVFWTNLIKICCTLMFVIKRKSNYRDRFIFFIVVYILFLPVQRSMNRCTVINKNLFLTSAWLMCTIGIISRGYCTVLFLWNCLYNLLKGGSGGRQLPVGSGVALRASSFWKCFWVYRKHLNSLKLAISVHGVRVPPPAAHPLR